MGDNVSVRVRATATAQGVATATARASATAQGGNASATATAIATVGIGSVSPVNSAAVAKRYRYADRFLADPSKPLKLKIALLKKLIKRDTYAQAVALKHLSKPLWVSYLKLHDNVLVRFVENFASAKLSAEQSRHVTVPEKALWIRNRNRAQLIWKKITSDVQKRRMLMYIGDRCDFRDSQLKKLKLGELKRLYKSVTSFRPPRECRL